MPDPLTSDRLAEIKRQVERAHTEIGEVALQGPHRRFRMSVPSRPDRDTDLIISDALKGAEELRIEVDRLKAENATLRGRAEAADWTIRQALAHGVHEEAARVLNQYVAGTDGGEPDA